MHRGRLAPQVVRMRADSDEPGPVCPQTPGDFCARGYNGRMNAFPIAAPVIDHDEHACRVAQVDGVEQVILFGSRARGDHRSDSDLNLLVPR